MFHGIIMCHCHSDVFPVQIGICSWQNQHEAPPLCFPGLAHRAPGSPRSFEVLGDASMAGSYAAVAGEDS